MKGTEKLGRNTIYDVMGPSLGRVIPKTLKWYPLPSSVAFIASTDVWLRGTGHEDRHRFLWYGKDFF